MSRIVKPTDKHIAFRTELIAVCKKHGNDLSGPEILALASHMVGQIIAFQDQRTMSQEEAINIVMLNIEQGNKDAFDEISNSVNEKPI